MWNPIKIYKASKVICARGGTDHYTYEETSEAIQEMAAQMWFPSNVIMRRKFAMSHERGLDVVLGRKDKDVEFQTENIIPRITSREYIESLPLNTVGANYGYLIKQWSFHELWDRRMRGTDASMPNPGDKSWRSFIWGNVSRHILISHDFWHAMTRYDTSRLGEACLMGITYAAMGHLSMWYMAHIVAAKMCWEYKSLLPLKVVRESIRIGKAIDRDFWYLNPLEIIEQDLEEAREKYNIGFCELFIKFNNMHKEEFRNDCVHPEYNDPKVAELVAQEI